jgi:multidrug efflux system membrane fusion protein
MTRRRRVLSVLGVLVLLVVLYEGTGHVIAYTDDAYVRSDLIAVAPQVTGRVLTVDVFDNQAVKAGDKLAGLDPEPFAIALAEREAAAEEARAQLNADQATLTAARDALASALSAEELARDTQRRVAALAEHEDVSRERLDQVDDTLRRAELAAAVAQAAISRETALQNLHQASLAHEEAAVADERWRLARTQLVAPADGTVTNLTVRPGDTGRADEPLFGIVDAHAWRIIANYRQSFLRRFSVGDTAWVWLDSEPWHFHRARISGIGRGISRAPEPDKLLPYVAPTTDWIRLQRRFPVTMVLDEPPPGGVLFMGADARVVIFP